MNSLNGPESTLQPALQQALQTPQSGRAMAMMGAVFAFTAFVALAIALLLEAPVADSVPPEATGAAPASEASAR